MSFKKIETKKKSAYVAEQIIEAVQAGIYKIGDKLPSEREIAEKTGVSRPSIREALLALQIVGIIEGRTGDGSYVRQGVGMVQGKLHVLSILEESEGPSEVLETRKALEEGVTKLAARKATREDLEKIEKALVRGIKAEENQDYEEFEEADRDFHRAIIGTCKNSLLENAIFPLVDVMRQRLWRKMKQSWLNSRHIRNTMDEHRRIFVAIKKRNESFASEEMVRHLDNSKKRFFGI